MRDRPGLHWPSSVSKSLIRSLLKGAILLASVHCTPHSHPQTHCCSSTDLFLQLWAGELPLISLECYEVRWPLFRSAGSVFSEVCCIEHLTGKYCMESNSSSTCSPLPAAQKPPHICRASPKDLLDFYLLGYEEL